jgi:hypothetical protein
MRSEFQKLRSPGVVYLALTAVLLLFALVGLAQQNDAGQWSIYTQAKQRLALPETRHVFCSQKDAGVTCDQKMALEQRDNEAFRQEIIKQRPYGALTQDPVGALGVVAGWMASLLGLAVVAGLAAVLVANEWGQGTARVILARRPSRWRYGLTKTAAVWSAAVALLVVEWLLLAAAGPVLSRVYHVAPASDALNPRHFACIQFVRALLPLGVFAAVSTAFGLLLRSPLASFIATMLVGLAAVASSAVRSALSFSPGYWLGSWMQFDPRGTWRDHLWPSSFPLGGGLDPVPQDPGLGFAGLSVSIAVVLAVGLTWFRRRDLRS